MSEIIFKIFPFLRRHMSERNSLLLSGFGSLALLLLGLSFLPSPMPKASSEILFLMFLFITAMIPVSLFVSWMFELKHLWDMRTVAVVEEDPRCKPFPQNAINAKKQGMKFRKPTKEELKEWGLDRKERFFITLKKLWYIKNEEIELKKLSEKLYDPDLSMKDYRRIREEQDNKTPLTNHSSGRPKRRH